MFESCRGHHWRSAGPARLPTPATGRNASRRSGSLVVGLAYRAAARSPRTRRHDDHQRSHILVARIPIGVVDVGVEHDRLAGGGRGLLLAGGHGEAAVEDVDDLARTGRMRLRHMFVSGSKRPVPRLDVLAAVAADDQAAAAAPGRAPELDWLLGADKAHSPIAAEVDQL